MLTLIVKIMEGEHFPSGYLQKKIGGGGIGSVLSHCQDHSQQLAEAVQRAS